MAAVQLVQVRNRAELKRFVGFPYDLYRDDPLWAPPLRRDVFKKLDPTNPFFEHGAACFFLAEREGRVVGRIAAIENRAHNEKHADRAGFFGMFESIEDAEVTGALIERAAEWLSERGLDEMRGPMSLSINDECGVLIDGFDTPPTLLTPHNPVYYSRLLEQAGLHKLRDLFQYERPVAGMPERVTRGARAMLRRHGLTLRSLSKGNLDGELEHVKRLFNEAWQDNWGAVPLTDAEIELLADELRPILVPELVVFAEKEGEVVGFAVALPDFNVALRTNRSGRLFPGILRILWAARDIRRVRVLLLGIDSRLRGTGIIAPLFEWIWRVAAEKGFEWSEAGWVLEENDGMNNALQRFGFERYKTLRIYGRSL